MKKYILLDDLDGTSEAAETVPFGFDGDMYEIDLSRENAKELRALLGRYTKVARPTRKRSVSSQSRTPASPSKPSKGKAKPKNGSVSPSEVREWAKSQGIDVNSTGRVPKTLVDQYVAAQSS